VDKRGRCSPFRLGILLIPQVQVMQLVVRVILEADGRRGRPLCVLFGDSLLGYALELDLLARAQLQDERAEAIGVVDDGGAEVLVHALADWNKIAGEDVHVLIARALSMERQPYTTLFAVAVAIAVARI